MSPNDSEDADAAVVDVGDDEDDRNDDDDDWHDNDDDNEDICRQWGCRLL